MDIVAIGCGVIVSQQRKGGDIVWAVALLALGLHDRLDIPVECRLGEQSESAGEQ
jgi:hypothetical protein